MHAKIKDTLLDKVRMPKSKKSSSKISGDFKKIIKQQGWKETVLRVVIINNDWSIVRNKYTGIILYRWIDAAVGGKTKDGTCKYFNVGIKQEYTGAGYGKSKWNGVGGSYDIKCKNINK